MEPKLGSYEQQQQYALERHLKGWCHPCKHFFSKNSTCASAVKGENCLFCHHKDHLEEMSSIIDNLVSAPIIEKDSKVNEDASEASKSKTIGSVVILRPPNTSGQLGPKASVFNSANLPGSFSAVKQEASLDSKSLDPYVNLNIGETQKWVLKKHEKGQCIACKFFASGKVCFQDPDCFRCHHPDHLPKFLPLAGTASTSSNPYNEAQVSKVRDEHLNGLCRPCIQHFIPGSSCPSGNTCQCCHDPEHGNKQSSTFYLVWLHEHNQCVPCINLFTSIGCSKGVDCEYCHHTSHRDRFSENYFSNVFHQRGKCRACPLFSEGKCPNDEFSCPYCHHQDHYGRLAASQSTTPPLFNRMHITNYLNNSTLPSNISLTGPPHAMNGFNFGNNANVINLNVIQQQVNKSLTSSNDQPREIMMRTGSADITHSFRPYETYGVSKLPHSYNLGSKKDSLSGFAPQSSSFTKNQFPPDFPNQISRLSHSMSIRPSPCTSIPMPPKKPSIHSFNKNTFDSRSPIRQVPVQMPMASTHMQRPINRRLMQPPLSHNTTVPPPSRPPSSFPNMLNSPPHIPPIMKQPAPMNISPIPHSDDQLIPKHFLVPNNLHEFPIPYQPAQVSPHPNFAQAGANAHLNNGENNEPSTGIYNPRLHSWKKQEPNIYKPLTRSPFSPKNRLQRR